MAMLVRKECMRWCTGAARSSLFVLGELSNATAKKQQQTAGSMTSLASRAYRALAGTSVGSSLGNTGVRCGAVAGSSHWAQSQPRPLKLCDAVDRWPSESRFDR